MTGATRLHRRDMLVALAGAWWALGRGRLARASAFDVLELESAMIGKIAEFVRWPTEAGLADPERPFELVMLGDGPLTSHLERYYARVTIAGHRVFVRRARSISDLGRPHLLYVAPSEEARLEPIETAIGGRATLTVGDTEGYAHRGLAVNLYRTDDQVRFEISRRAFARHRLQASYRLLGLARLIEDQQARR